MSHFKSIMLGKKVRVGEHRSTPAGWLWECDAVVEVVAVWLTDDYPMCLVQGPDGSLARLELCGLKVVRS